ncbi:hypothetical protein CMALT394_60023 [Carnobacterium maltaromaticum]|nr:hypothetical protein CMALT394_60023 [Carnobacterium maltaromaticum]
MHKQRFYIINFMGPIMAEQG